MINDRKLLRNGGKITYVNSWIKYILCFSNFIFILIGLFLMTIGTVAVYDSNLTSLSKINFLYFILNLAVLCAFIGLILIIVAFFGFLGTLREIGCLLKVYYWTLVVFLLLELTIFFGVFFARDSIKYYLETFIKETFIQQYREIGYEDTSNLIDLFQREFECCGPNSYRDWNENRYFKCNSTLASPWKCGVPHSCCRKMNDIDEGVINIMCGMNVNKQAQLKRRAPNFYISEGLLNSQKIWQVGCVQAVFNYVEDNITHVVVVLVLLLILQIIFIVMAKNLQNQIADQIRLLKQENTVLRTIRT